MADKGAQWLLVEHFDDSSLSIINMSGRPEKFTPIGQRLKNRGAEEHVRAVMKELRRGRDNIAVESDGRFVHARALRVDEHLHGAWYWSGRTPPPPVPAAGAWRINLTTMTALGSREWAEMADIPQEYWGQERSLAAMFAQVDTDSAESVAIKKIITAKAGTVHQGKWSVTRQDGTKWPAHFSCRIYRETTAEGHVHMVARGLSVDIGGDPKMTAAPEIVLLEHRVLDALTEPGEYRALVDLKSLRLIRWMGGPAPGIAWQKVASEPEPEVHPDDHATMIEMAKGLARQRTTGRLRVRALDGTWTWLNVTASLVAIDQETTAALLQVKVIDDLGVPNA